MTRASLDFSGFITSRTKDFTGREWVFFAINRWLADEGGKRVFLLTGEPGCGKSALASCLVQLSQGELSAPANCPALKPNFLSAFHFCSASKQTWINPHTFTTSLALQLADHYPVYAQALAELNKDERIHIEVRQTAQQIRDQGKQIGVYIENLDVSRISAEDAFVRTVCEPLTVLATEQPNQPIVILVDALDEALVYTGQRTIVDLLARTEELPSNVRFLLTSRQEPQVENEFLDAAGLFISADKNRDQNDKDIHQYITTQFREVSNLKTMATQLKPDEQQKAINTIVNKADGNFLYITFLLVEMANGQRQLTDLQGLPTRLDGLYHQSLERLVQQGKRNWPDDYAPICGILSVAQDALTLSQLVMLTKQPEEALCSHLIDLQQFVEDVTPAVGTDVEVVYRLYHQSVADFLHRRYYIRHEDEQSKNNYYLNAESWHRHIADYYWQTYHGDWMSCDTYGLKSLAIHLDQSSKDKHKDERLSALITKTWMNARYIGNGYTYNGFLADVDLAWQAVGSQGENKDTLPLLVRLQTARQIVGEEVSTYTDEDLRILVLLGREREALSNAQLRSNPEDRFAGLLAVHSAQKNMTGKPNPTLLSKASEAANLIQDANSQAQVLIQLAVALAEAGDNQANTVFEEAHTVATSIQDTSMRTQALRELAVALAKTKRFDKAYPVAASMQDVNSQAQALTQLAVALAEAGDNQANTVFEEAHTVATSIQDASMRTLALGGLAVALAEAKDNRASTMFDEARTVTTSIQDTSVQVQGLRNLAVALARAKDNRAIALFDEAHVIASSIRDTYAQVQPLVQFAIALSQARGNCASALLDEVHTIVASTQSLSDQTRILSELAIDLGRVGQFGLAYKTARSLSYAYDRVKVLSQFAAVLAQKKDSRSVDIFEEAKKEAYSIPKKAIIAEALGKLAIALAQVGQFADAQELIDEIQDSPAKKRTQRTVRDLLAQTHHSDKAKAAASNVPFESDITKVTALPKVGHFKEELGKLETSKLNEFLRTLGEWAPAFEQITPGLSVIILCEATGVAGWINSFWRKIHDMLAAPVIENREESL